MQTDSVIIKSSNGNAEIEFSEREGLSCADGSEYYRVTLRSNELTTSTRIYAFQPFGAFCWQYFENLASSWRGWNGKKDWKSLESDFSFSAESDSVGHTTIEVVLESYGNWRAQITLNLDAGQLEEVASKVQQFFSEQETTKELIR